MPNRTYSAILFPDVFHVRLTFPSVQSSILVSAHSVPLLLNIQSFFQTMGFKICACNLTTQLL